MTQLNDPPKGQIRLTSLSPYTVPPELHCTPCGYPLADCNLRGQE